MAVRWQAVKAQPWLKFLSWPESRRLQAGALVVTLALLGLSAADLAGSPPLWWDEGWTLMVARNWVDFGHYGRLLDGAPTNSMLSAAFPVTAPVALSFKLFGVGGWQGRLPGVVFLAGALALLFVLAQRLYTPRVALAALLFLALFFPHPEIHPGYLSRQVLGEPAMMFYLLAGYALSLLALKGRSWLWPVAALVWGLALKSKLQVLPFWLASLGLGLAFLLLQRRWRQAAWLLVSAALAVAVYQLIGQLQPLLLPGYMRAAGDLAGLNEVTAFVLDPEARWAALRLMVLFGGPVMVGLGLSVWREGRAAWRPSLPTAPEQTVRLMLLALAGSWGLWFGLLSVGWVRYLYPVLFIGGLFLMARLGELTQDFDVRAVGRDLRAALTAPWRARLGALAVLGLVAWMGLLGARMWRAWLSRPSDQSVYAAAAFLNTHTPPDARIETYDSQLLFLLDRRYHYPPDELHVAAIRREFIDAGTPLDYDGLAADPDYLVLGPFSSWMGLYEAELAEGQFALVFQNELYAVYQRHR